MRRSLTYLLLLLSSWATAQIIQPESSPRAQLEQRVGLTDITIEYSRPSLKGRRMFGGLLPYGELWRTGANASTKVTFSEAVQVQGHRINAGTYALYTIPNPDYWTVILHNNTELWGTGGTEYKREEEACRFTVRAQKLLQPVETFTIDINEIRTDSAFVYLMWEDVRIRFHIGIDTDSKVLADIKQKMRGISSTTYYQAAQYYLETGRDSEMALDWINAAIDMEGENFWLLHLKALILADLGQERKAKRVAEQSLSLARKADNENYVKMNQRFLQGLKRD